MTDSSDSATDLEAFLDADLDGLARLAGVLTGDRDDAADLLTSALVSAAAGWNRTSERTDRLAYVRRIVVIAFLGDRRNPADAEADEDTAAPADTAGAAGPASPAAARPTVGRELAGLPRRRLAAVVLRDYLGLPESTARAALGASVGAYRSQLAGAELTVRTVPGLDADRIDGDELRRRIASALTARERFVPDDLPALRDAALEEAPVMNGGPVRRNTTAAPLMAAVLIAVVVLAVVLALALF